MTIPDRVEALVNEIGETITYRRVTQGTYDPSTGTVSNTTADTSIKAAFRDFRPQDMVGMVQQGDRRCFIAANDLAFEPEKADQIIAEGKTYTIQAVNQRTARDANAIFILHIRGDGK